MVATVALVATEASIPLPCRFHSRAGTQERSNASDQNRTSSPSLLGHSPATRRTRESADTAPSRWLSSSPPPSRSSGTQTANAQADFLRGDVNDDGVVTISDAHRINTYFFLGSPEPDCVDSIDINDDGELNITDSIELLNSMFYVGDPVAAPNPEAGSDPTEDELACETYTGSQPHLDDAGAAMRLIAQPADGGADSTASILVNVDHSTEVAGCSGSIAIPSGLFEGVHGTTPTAEFQGGYHAAKFVGDRIDFGLLVTLTQPISLPPGEQSVLRIDLCLKPGAAAGTYPLSLSSGELIDAVTAKRIEPVMIDDDFVLANDVLAEPGPCATSEPPIVDDMEEVEVEFRIETAATRPEEGVTLSVLASANTPLEAVRLAIDYDETRLIGNAIRPSSGVQEPESFVFDLNNDDLEAGSTEGTEGYVTVEIIYGEGSDGFVPRQSSGRHFLDLEITPTPDAPNGPSPVQFTHLATLANSVTVLGQEGTSENLGRFRLRDGLVAIDNGTTVFVRGDANSDGQFSISDPTMLRRWLFLGGTPPECLKTGDIDDDGVVDITDPIRALNAMFLGGDLPQNPFPEAGLDPTPDELACLFYTPIPPTESPGDLIYLEDVSAAAGQTVAVPIRFSVSVESEAWQLVIRYDPEVVTEVIGLDFSNTFYAKFNNPPGFSIAASHPENGAIAVGWIGSLTDEDHGVPAGEDVLAAKLLVKVSEDVTEGTTVPLELLATRDAEEMPHVAIEGTEITTLGEARFVSVVPQLQGAVLRVVGDITFFRGDANGDRSVDLADAVFTLNYLFASGPTPPCPDAADSDDNGRILVNDPIMTLNELFGVISTVIPAPYPDEGRDPTPDDLSTCLAPAN